MSIEVRKLDMGDYPMCHSMDRKLNPKEKQLVEESTEEEITKCLTSGYSVGFCVEDRLVAVMLVYTDSYNYAAYVEKIITSDPYRGRGVQRALMNYAKFLLKFDGYEKLVALSHVLNSPSVSHFLKSNFKRISTKKNLFGTGAERELFEYEISSEG